LILKSPGIEELKERREEVNKAISLEEQEKERLSNDLRLLKERLSKLDESLQRKYASRSEYDRTIKDTEVQYMKVTT
jgi:Sjoegren syndrome nuclear autoantigen 1